MSLKSLTAYPIKILDKPSAFILDLFLHNTKILFSIIASKAKCILARTCFVLVIPPPCGTNDITKVLLGLMVVVFDFSLSRKYTKS